MSYNWGRKTVKSPLDEAALYDYAVGALGRRMRTVAELKRLMKTRVEEEASGEMKIQAVLIRLQEHGYLNDTNYAAAFTRLRQENERFGRRRVEQELTRKGIPAEIIANTVEPAYENISEEDLARKHLERKRIQKPAGDKETARVVRRLVRAGFSTKTIFKILKNWQLSDETLAALETLETGIPDPEENSGPE